MLCHLVPSRAEVAPERQPIVEALERYFTADDAKERRQRAAEVAAVAEGSVGAVVQALGDVNVWKDVAPASGDFTFSAPSGGTIEIAYRLPEDYDPAERYPLMVCFPESSSHAVLTEVVDWLGAAAAGSVRIAPDERAGGSFYQRDGAASDLPALMRAVRKRFHIDTNRVLAYGHHEGGAAAWTAVLMYPAWFTGAIVRSAYPRLPYPEQVYPLLLPNLRGCTVLTSWVAGDAPAVAAHNHAILGFASLTSLAVTGVSPTTDNGSTRDTAAIRDQVRKQLARLLASPVRPPPQRVAHWFRYVPQGRAGWLRSSALHDEAWDMEQLSILPAPADDRDAVIVDTIKHRLAYLGGSVERQTITVRTVGCEEVELLLPDGLIDWSVPVTVSCNGRIRHEGVIRPSIRTLLGAAYESWDFQHPVFAELSMTVRKDAEMP